MPSVYQHGVVPPPEVDCETVVIDNKTTFSLLTHPGNVFNDRLIYDIPTTSFKPTNNPIDDRIRKNTLLIDWCKRLDTHLLTKYSYECIKDPDQLEIYHFLSSLVQAKEAINFLTVLISSPKAIHTEYYSSIRDIYSFLREAGNERYPCMIQIAAILMTLCKHRILPVNPTWGFIRTPSLQVSYSFGSQSYTIKTEHIIVMQSSTNFIRQMSSVSDITYYNIFAAAVGLQPGKYTSIVEWIVLNCGSYCKTKRKFYKPLFTQPLTDQALGSTVYIEGMSDKITGILLANNSTSCTILISDDVSAYVEPNVSKALVTVAPPVQMVGDNMINVY